MELTLPSLLKIPLPNEINKALSKCTAHLVAFRTFTSRPLPINDWIRRTPVYLILYFKKYFIMYVQTLYLIIIQCLLPSLFRFFV